MPGSTGKGPGPSSPCSCPLPLPGSQTLQGVNTFAGSNTRTPGEIVRKLSSAFGAVLAIRKRFLEGQSARGTGDSERYVLVIYPQMCHLHSAFSSCPLACLNFTIMYLILKVICSHLLTLIQMIKENS